MRNVMLTALLVSLAPGYAVAQGSANASMTSDASAGVNAGGAQMSSHGQASATTSLSIDRGQREQAMRGLSAAVRTRAEATFQAARNEDLPEQPVASAMLEAQAKGASEAQVLGAGQQALGRLQLAKQAMVHAGRSNPSSDEVSRGANVLARGATSVQLEVLARKSSSDRSLVVAFETLGQLTARGVPVTTAVAEIGSKLDAHASDDAIRSLSTSLTASANVGGGLNRSAGQGGATNGVVTSVGAAGSAGAAVGHGIGGATAAGSLTGGLTGGLSHP
jgi:hypothetical protein